MSPLLLFLVYILVTISDRWLKWKTKATSLMTQVRIYKGSHHPRMSEDKRLEWCGGSELPVPVIKGYHVLKVVHLIFFFSFSNDEAFKVLKRELVGIIRKVTETPQFLVVEF